MLKARMQSICDKVYVQAFCVSDFSTVNVNMCFVLPSILSTSSPKILNETYPGVPGEVIKVRGGTWKTVDATTITATLYAILNAMLTTYTVGLTGFATKHIITL